ncbi:hypothetical protein GWO43_26085 [candidate division KSB1 bacterium]|nr:hypothetical protein [candidate division KSB1 bacterium]NIV70231.1 hypothetical protein [Phycisphaerae bacterium]NIR71119.1 hypothetical protein [candidate division KSB1 bacterium]NIS26135.1 hypothetical protein [candidate division KSB1 bacterium]NIT74281.1 hypothetical protein [candidate division KSB1 bacterium]
MVNIRKLKLQNFFYAISLLSFTCVESGSLNQAQSIEDRAIIKASGCSQAEVQAAIDSASDGTVVLVPAGNCIWTSGIDFSNKNITVQGAGIDQTIITDATGSAWNEVPIFISGTESKPFRITGFTFTGQDGSNGIIMIRGNSKNWRIDDCKFEISSGIEIGWYSWTYGVIDHCIFTGNKTFSCILVHADDSTDWARPLSLGGEKAVYVEDCTFDFKTVNEWNVAIDASFGGRFVFRHNKLTNITIGTHDVCNNPGRGVHSYEIYENSFTMDGQSAYRGINLRGGTGVIYNNTFTTVNGGNFTNPIMVTNYRSCSEIVQDQCERFGWDTCDGNSQLDGNLDSTGYPCLDQIGRTSDIDGDGIQDSAPLYEWNNALDGSDTDIKIHTFDNCDNSSVRDHIKENRDYYNDKPMPGYTPYAYPHPLSKGSSSTKKS